MFNVKDLNACKILLALAKFIVLAQINKNGFIRYKKVRSGCPKNKEIQIWIRIDQIRIETLNYL